MKNKNFTNGQFNSHKKEEPPWIPKIEFISNQNVRYQIIKENRRFFCRNFFFCSVYDLKKNVADCFYQITFRNIQFWEKCSTNDSFFFYLDRPTIYSFKKFWVSNFLYRLLPNNFPPRPEIPLYFRGRDLKRGIIKEDIAHAF